MDCYLDQELYEKVKQFNSQPGSFDHEGWVQQSIQRFRAKQKEQEEKAVKVNMTEKVKLGPQSHSKVDMPKIPGSNEYFILDEIKKRMDFNKK